LSSQRGPEAIPALFVLSNRETGDGHIAQTIPGLLAPEFFLRRTEYLQLPDLPCVFGLCWKTRQRPLLAYSVIVSRVKEQRDPARETKLDLWKLNSC
jgi:hypothetical protein